MKPTAQQQRVIDSTDRDILVVAGAGSGKTTTTVNRYIRLISEAGYEPHEILAFTFTDKAAGDLRRKVREARRKLITESGESDPGVVLMSSAWIGTFHAICNRILKAYPVEAGVDPGFTVIDEVTSATLRGRAFSDALESLLREGGDDDRRERMVGLFTESRLRETVFAVFNELRSRGIARPRFPDFPDTSYPTEKIEYLRRDIGRVAELTGHGKNQRKSVDALELLLRDPGRDIRLGDLGPLAFTSTRSDRSEFCDVLNDAVADLAAHEQGDSVRRDIGRLLELFSERFTRLKSSRSLLDYEDLQLMTLALLRDPGHRRIRDAYRKRFREIMVDEFQDTNRLQLDLVKELRGEDTTLMTVGDEMQSIYGFRHADVELFRQRRDRDGVIPYLLTDNFRSQPEVIAAVNEIGFTFDRQVEGHRGEADDSSRHEFSPLTVGRDDPETKGSVTAILTGHDGWKPLDLGELAPPIPTEAEIGKDQDHFNQAEALRLAHHLRAAVDRGVVKQGDIAILLRAKTRADLYVSALNQVGLSPYLAGGRGFWKSREAVDLRSLLSVIANPLEDEALLGALVSPACGVSSDALWLLRRAAPKNSPLWPVVRSVAGDPLPEGGNGEWLEELPGEDRNLLERFVSTIDRLRLLANRIPLDSLVEETITTTGYDLSNLIRDRSRNGMANIRRVASLAREYEFAEGRDLRGFLNWVLLSADLDRESMAATEDEGSDVIRIMTVHAAKGLEFRMVCVPDCGREIKEQYNLPVRVGKATRGRDRLDFEVGLRLPTVTGGRFELFGWPDLQDKAKRANEDEELRLFHVALTRAQDHLVISGVLPDKPKHETTPAMSAIGRFCVGFDLDNVTPDAWPATVPEGPDPDANIGLEPNFASGDAAAKLRQTGSFLGRSRGVAIAPPPIFRPEPTVYPNVPLSFTAINEYEECPARFFAGRILRLEDPAKPGPNHAPGDPELENVNRRDHGTRFGSAVHDILEMLGKSRWPDLKDEMVRDALDKRGADPSGFRPARKMIGDFRETDLGRRLASGHASFEAPLLVRVRGITIRGFADVFLDLPVPLILDYKTNRLEGRTPAEKMTDYVQQRNLYALAVSRARETETVETAFVFLERPDEPVLETLNRDDLELAGAGLGSVLEDITAGRFFEPTESGRAPCGACWGCSALSGQIGQHRRNPPSASRTGEAPPAGPASERNVGSGNG